MASIHGTDSTILAVQISAPCSPWRNWESVQFWFSTPNATHSFSLHFSSGVPEMSKPTAWPPWAAAASITSFSWSTSVSHGRSVSPFHWAFLAFS